MRIDSNFFIISKCLGRHYYDEIKIFLRIWFMKTFTDGEYL